MGEPTVILKGIFAFNFPVHKKILISQYKQLISREFSNRLSIVVKATVVHHFLFVKALLRQYLVFGLI